MSDYLGHEDACPICFHKLDAAACVSGRAKPKPGDVAVCAYCAELLMFDDNLRHVCLDENGGLESLQPEERTLLLNAQQAVRDDLPLFKRYRGRPS